MIPENELIETWEARKNNLGYSIYAEHDFGIPEARNDFQKSTDLDKEKNISQLFIKKIYI